MGTMHNIAIYEGVVSYIITLQIDGPKLMMFFEMVFLGPLSMYASHKSCISLGIMVTILA